MVFENVMDAPAARGGQLHGENSVSFGCVEALRDRVECAFAADEDEGQIQIGGCTENAMKVHHQLTDDGAGINESHVALVDTACTSCMHSRKWREEYSKSLPEGYACEKTEKFKVFHFADGSSTSHKVAVWKIPIFLGNRPGQVQSAEVDTGTTPLLLSIAALVALDAVLFMKKKVMRVEALDQELELLETGTRHYAVKVAYDLELENKTVTSSPPACQSVNDDFFVYLGREAAYSLMYTDYRHDEMEVEQVSCKVQFGARGIRLEDQRGELSLRRAQELARTIGRLRTSDSRTWAALRRNYTLAEQGATEGFTNTVIFEPFGGRFGTTRVASSEWGWTCSQPLDLLDGYDLLGEAGRRHVFQVLQHHRPFLTIIAFDCRIWSIMTNMTPDDRWQFLRKTVGLKTLRLVRDICKYQFNHARFYLVENPIGSKAWTYRQIMMEIIKEMDGKFAIGDQCPFGKRDRDSLRPEQKRTGWLSNSEVLLNQICRRCSCPQGAHQPIVGSNSGGSRSKQASEYPQPLCRAICRGVQREMEMLYVIRELRGEHALPAEDEEEDEPMPEAQQEPVPDEEMVDEDRWELKEVEFELVRHHLVPRRALFAPLDGTDPPVPLDRITGKRINHIRNVGEDKDYVFTDDWHDRAEAGRDLDRSWTGKTVFELLPQELVLPEQQAPPAEDKPVTLRRRRARTRQLQRGMWTNLKDDKVQSLVDATMEVYRDSGSVGGWIIIDKNSEVGQEWRSLESAQADVRLILASVDARRMKKPQPHVQPAEVPLRKTLLYMASKDILSTSWEDWQQLAPSSQLRPFPNQSRVFCITLFGALVGEDEVEPGDGAGRPSDPLKHKEAERERKWQALPRELKLALQRIHVNLGHARLPDMLRALRVSKASEIALRACRLFRCKECPRLLEPKIPRPSRLPHVDEFNVVVGLDVLSEKDSNGDEWCWLNVVDEGTGFQVCSLLGDTLKNPTSLEVVKTFEMSWSGWAGMPERGVIVDRAKYFLGELASRLSEEGCHVDSAAKASPWQIAFVERAGGIWKSTLRRMVWSEQLAGKEDMYMATSAVNSARNNLTRRSGFSPSQWVLGRSIRVPADLKEESEVVRIGAQCAAETPTTRFFRKNQIRMAAREAFMKVANDSALRRAELRRVRPTRGPFSIGDYVFFYDQADGAPGPNHWRGVARVVGREGSCIIWIFHRGILVAASPEHLAHANEEEIRGWMVTANETTLMDAMPAAGGTGFLDIRARPAPPAEGFPEEPEEKLPAVDERREKEAGAEDKAQGADEPPTLPAQASDRETCHQTQRLWPAWSMSLKGTGRRCYPRMHSLTRSRRPRSRNRGGKSESGYPLSRICRCRNTWKCLLARSLILIWTIFGNQQEHLRWPQFQRLQMFPNLVNERQSGSEFCRKGKKRKRWQLMRSVFPSAISQWPKMSS